MTALCAKIQSIKTQLQLELSGRCFFIVTFCEQIITIIDLLKSNFNRTQHMNSQNKIQNTVFK